MIGSHKNKRRYIALTAYYDAHDRRVRTAHESFDADSVVGASKSEDQIDFLGALARIGAEPGEVRYEISFNYCEELLRYTSMVDQRPDVQA
jgi:hypothetical protein